MNIRLLVAGRVGAAALTATAALLATLLVSVPAAAAVAPSAPALTWTGDDAAGVDACMDFPCQGATPGHPWSFSATTGGLALNDVVAFAFSSTATDRFHAVAMPVTLDVNSIDVNLTGKLESCYNIVDSTPTHPASVSVDWANQTFSFPMPGALTAGQTAQFCFTDGQAIGMPLTPSPEVSPYSLTYTEAGGSVSAGYQVLARRADPVANGNEVAPPFVHITDAASNDMSNAGEAGTPLGFTNTTYNIQLTGVPNIAYALTADSGRTESNFGADILDPRVTVNCPSTCTTDGSGSLAATFSVSAGALDHFVIRADCVSIDEASCLFGDSGVTAFTVANVVPTPTASVQPALPRAGRAPRSGAPWTAVILLGAIGLACGAAVWRASRLRGRGGNSA